MARRRGAVAGLAVGAVILVLGGLMFLNQAVQAGRNSVVFDGDDALRACVDGKEVGALKANAFRVGYPTASVPPGRHRLELVDAQGRVVVSATPELPAQGWRGVLSARSGTRYALVTVRYGGGIPSTVQPLLSTSPGLFVVVGAESPPLAEEMRDLNGRIPARGKGKASMLCRLDSKGSPTCL